MTDNDRRGAYTPPNDEPLHFDARRPRGGGGGGTPPTTLLVSAVVLLVLVGGAFAYYRSGVRHEGQAPAVVGNPVGETKSVAPPSAQPVDPAEGLQVYNSETPQAANTPAPTLAPAPEEPLPRISGPKPTAPVAQATLPVAPPAQQMASAEPAKALPVKPVPAKAAPVKAPPPVQVATATPPAKAVTTAVKGASGPAAVQIGAFSSNAQAEKGWNAVARVSPSKMLGKGKRVETIEKDGTTFYRTFVTGFASREDASAFCDDLKSAGKSCLVK